jgi:hypothetical protein
VKSEKSCQQEIASADVTCRKREDCAIRASRDCCGHGVEAVRACRRAAEDAELCLQAWKKKARKKR